MDPSLFFDPQSHMHMRSKVETRTVSTQRFYVTTLVRSMYYVVLTDLARRSTSNTSTGRHVLALFHPVRVVGSSQGGNGGEKKLKILETAGTVGPSTNRSHVSCFRQPLSFRLTLDKRSKRRSWSFVALLVQSTRS